MDTNIETPPPLGSRERLLGWDEWYMTVPGVAAYALFSLLGWGGAVSLGFMLGGMGGFALGHIVGLFVTVPTVSLLMTWFYQPRKARPYKW